MKYVVLSAICFALAGCASAPNGGGWVVGNGMTDQGTAQEGMNSFGTDQIGVGDKKGCACEPGETTCHCAEPAKKKRNK